MDPTHAFGFSVMSIVRAIIATILATTLGIGIIIAELDETVLNVATAEVTQETVDTLAAESGPLNFDSTFLLLTAAIIILIVPDAIAYFRRRKAPEKEGPE